MSDLVFYLWPAQPLATLVVPDNGLIAFVLAVGGNVLLFAVIGLMVGSVASRPTLVPAAYGAVCSVLLFLALWDAGYRVQHLDAVPLLLAALICGVPFRLVEVRARRQVG